MDFRKYLKIFSQNDNSLLEFLAVVSFFVVAVPLWMFLHFWSLLIFAVLLANLLILIVHYKNISVPILSSVVAKEYEKIKIKTFLDEGNHRLRYFLDKNYLRLLRHSALLFITAEDNRELLVELGIKQQEKEKFFQEYPSLFKAQKRQALHFSAAGSLTLIVAAFVLSIIFAPQTNASTFGWLQADWSGGISTIAMAAHPDNKTGWNKYYSKDSTVEASSSVSINATTTITMYTSNTDFSSNTSANAYVASGSIYMLKPTNATCAHNDQCSNNSCLNGTCFVCGVDTVAYYGGKYDANGISTTTGGYYRTVAIGDQCWLKENLATTKYNDNSDIPNITDQTAWASDTTGAYCWYNNDYNTYGKIYGGLYNFYAVNTGKLCPSGWHVPSHSEFTALYDYLGGTSAVGAELSAAPPVWGGNNSTGFAALKSGFRDSTGFNYFGGYTNIKISDGSHFQIQGGVSGYFEPYTVYGESVRCLK
ncbi:MAG: fibrobacter succinogenes major paralogous domain-containing protein [Patescibacteria group bacterium]|nr:fibrobacter succinogenes major paralogous domain-containing protein [Patescibacteria group bacterium]